MEDLCLLTERLTEDKYQGSYEQIAKAIWKYSAQPGLDVVNFFEQVLFSFLTGNADMHLKNFSLIHLPARGPMLSPAYDMIATALVNPAGLDDRQQENIFRKMERAQSLWRDFIDASFLSADFKEALKTIILRRFERLYAAQRK